MKNLSLSVLIFAIGVSLTGTTFADETEYLEPSATHETESEAPLLESDDTEAAVAWAWCAGGPRSPAYAFYNYAMAQRCAGVIARQGYECQRFVRVGRCYVYNAYDIGAVRPNFCQCQPRLRPVGQWVR